MNMHTKKERKLEKLLGSLPQKEVSEGFSERVMHAIQGRRPGMPVFSEVKKWVVLGLACLFLAAVFLSDLPLLPQLEITQLAGYRRVELVFYSPSQSPKTVAVAGDFSNWDYVEMKEIGDDYWQVTVQVKPGRYQYAFVIDGEQWLPDPLSPRKVADGFGGFNSVLVVNGFALGSSVE